MSIRLGIDVGGTAIKASLVDTAEARVLDRHECPTPDNALPASVAGAVRRLAERVGHTAGEPIGVCVPAVVVDGITMTAANIDAAWIGMDAASLFASTMQGPVRIINDADAAGVAEVSALTAADRAGVVITVTLGTGVGSALFTDGILTPNTELGHLVVDGHLVDRHVALSAMRREDLHPTVWGKRVARYLDELDALFTPSRIIVGGGGSVYFDEVAAHLTRSTTVSRARFDNDGGIIGAAATAAGSPV